MTGIPQVVFLKYLLSFGKLHTIPFCLPITLFVLAATMRLMIIEKDLDRDRRPDRWMELISLQGEIIKPESEDIPDLRIQPHDRQRIGGARQLQLCLLHMIIV